MFINITLPIMLLMVFVGCTENDAHNKKTKSIQQPFVSRVMNIDYSNGKPSVSVEKKFKYQNSKIKKRPNNDKFKLDSELEPIPVGQTVDVLIYGNNVANGDPLSNPRLVGDSEFSIISSTCHGVLICETLIRFTPTVSGEFVVDFVVNYGSAPGIPGGPGSHRIYAWGYDNPEEPECPRCEFGSILNIDAKGVIESIPIVGTDISLNYSSNFMEEYFTKYPNVGRRDTFNPEGFSVSVLHSLDVVEGRLFLGTGFVRKVSPISSGSNYLVAIDDNVYVFSSTGKHIETKSSLTGITKYTFHYEANDKIDIIEDSFGNEIEFTRNSSGHLTSVISPYGQITTIARNTDQLITKITNPKSESFEFFYFPSSSLLESVMYPSGREKFYEYSDSGELRYYERPDGQVTEWFLGVSYFENQVNWQVSPSGLVFEGEIWRDLITGVYTRKTKAPSGFEETYEEGYNRSQSVVNAYATTSKTTQSDPRFGAYRPITNLVSETIDGLTRSTSYDESITGSGYFSYGVLTRESSVNSKTTTSVFTRSTKTEVITDPSSVQSTIVYNAKE